MKRKELLSLKVYLSVLMENEIRLTQFLQPIIRLIKSPSFDFIWVLHHFRFLETDSLFSIMFIKISYHLYFISNAFLTSSLCPFHSLYIHQEVDSFAIDCLFCFSFSSRISFILCNITLFITLYLYCSWVRCSCSSRSNTRIKLLSSGTQKAVH